MLTLLVAGWENSTTVMFGGIDDIISDRSYGNANF